MAFCSALQVWKLSLLILVLSASGKFEYHFTEGRSDSQKCHSDFMALPYVPVPSPGIYRTSSIHFAHAFGILEPVLRNCASRHVLPLACPFYSGRHCCFTSAHHQHFPTSHTTHALFLLPTNQGDIYEYCFPRSSLHSSCELDHDDWNRHSHCRLQ